MKYVTLVNIINFNNRYVKTLLFCFLVSIVGKAQAQNFVNFAVAEPLSPSLTNVLLHTSDISYAGGWLFVQDEIPDYHIQAYNPSTGEKEYGFGRRGRGPGEYLSVSIQKGPGDGLIEISDVKNKKNDIYDVSCLKKKPPTSQVDKCIVSTVPILATRQAIILENDLVINHGSNTEGVLFLSKDSQKLTYIDEKPQSIRERYRRPLHEAMAMTGLLAANPDRTWFAYFADSFDRALFYKRSGNDVSLFKESKYTFLPEFEVTDFGRSSMLVPADNYISAFRSPVAGRNHYFVLYSGKSNEDVSEELMEVDGADWRSFTNIVKVYSWDGREVAEIQLSEEVLFISVNYNETVLYGVTFNKNIEATIIKAEIR